MVVFADFCIAGFLLTTFYGEKCKYNEYRDALHCNNINMDLPLKLTSTERLKNSEILWFQKKINFFTKKGKKFFTAFASEKSPDV